MKKRIKILYLLPSLRKTGPILGIYALVKYLDSNRCDITVAILDAPGKDSNTILPELALTNARVKIFDMPGWFGLLKIGRIRKFIGSEDFDIIHSYGLRPDLINSLIKKQGISVSYVREIPEKNYYLLYGWLISGFSSILHLWALRRINFIISISGKIKEYLISKGFDEGKIYYIPNFVDLSWADSTNYLKVAPELRLNPDVAHIGVIGNLIRRKRVDWAIKACADLLDRNRSIKIALHVIGNGPLWNKLHRISVRQGVEDTVFFHGHVENPVDIINKLDLVILPSESEGIPRAILEAMLLGKTCIGSNIGGVNELIKDGDTGYLFRHDSIDDLVNKMEGVLINKGFLDPLKIKRHIEDNFDAVKGARKTLDLYEKLTSEKLENTIQR